jgi:hypothetical protein
LIEDRELDPVVRRQPDEDEGDAAAKRVVGVAECLRRDPRAIAAAGSSFVAADPEHRDEVGGAGAGDLDRLVRAHAAGSTNSAKPPSTE